MLTYFEGLASLPVPYDREVPLELLTATGQWSQGVQYTHIPDEGAAALAVVAAEEYPCMGFRKSAVSWATYKGSKPSVYSSIITTYLYRYFWIYSVVLPFSLEFPMG